MRCPERMTAISKQILDLLVDSEESLGMLD
jgi:hypothetical protein